MRICKDWLGAPLTPSSSFLNNRFIVARVRGLLKNVESISESAENTASKKLVSEVYWIPLQMDWLLENRQILPIKNILI